MRDSCLAVGVNHDQNKERTKARVARRKDLQKFCSNIENVTLKEYIVIHRSFWTSEEIEEGPFGQVRR